MTAPLAVRLERVTKTYRIPRPDAPRAQDYLRRPGWAFRAPKSQDVSALRDVSFELQEGEILGIVGRNGAGKSTLLKVLSRITSPTSGRVTMRGRVASLLEVGTGFHPELTGRENIYLNGMLLGMSSRQVGLVYDQICEFASVGDYINVPIKRYSSGMKLRLAFSVAAHLRADIMIIDEVLAVGDAEFQRKCLGVMEDVGRAGRTALLVSHNMSAIEALCTRVIWLDHGEIRQIGTADEVVRSYLRSGLHAVNSSYPTIDLSHAARGFRLGIAHLSEIAFHRLGPGAEREPWRVKFGEPFALDIGLSVSRDVPGVVVGIGIRNERGEDLLTSHSSDCIGMFDGASRPTRARVLVNSPWLRPGAYFVEVSVISGSQLLDRVPDAACLQVEEVSSDGAPLLSLKKGPLSPMWSWQLE